MEFGCRPVADVRVTCEFTRESRQAVPGKGSRCGGRRPGQRPGPSPGTNSPQDCLCPGSVHRPEVELRNSLRSLRSRRSDSRSKSDDEAREYTRRPRGCAPRRPRVSPCRVPTAANTTSGGVPAGAPPVRDAGWRWCPRAQAPFASLRQLARQGGVDVAVAARHRSGPRAWAGERGRRRRPAAIGVRMTTAERQQRAASGRRNSCN
jgi:hypothetical protein